MNTDNTSNSSNTSVGNGPTVSPAGTGVAGNGTPGDGTANGTGGTGIAVVDTGIVDVTDAHEKVKAMLLPPLSKAGKKHLPKVRKKAQATVPLLIGLTTDRPSLCPAGKTPQELIAQLALCEALQALLNPTTTLYTSVKDTVVQLESDLFQSALAIYGIAQYSKTVDPAVVAVVEQMKNALAVGTRVKHVVTRTSVPKPAKKSHAPAPVPVPASSPAPVATPAVAPTGASQPAVTPAAAPGPGPAPTGK